MRQALRLAERAREEGEVPVGAVLVRDGNLIAEGWNHPISSHDPTAHAEIIALRGGAAAVGNYRVVGTTLYVTLEPCMMCAGALIHARVERLVYGADDPKTGAAGGAVNLLDAPFVNHRVRHQGGVLEKECGTLLSEFFKSRRRQS